MLFMRNNCRDLTCLIVVLSEDNSFEVITVKKKRPLRSRNKTLPGIETAIYPPNLVIPKEDTHPGTGLRHFNGKVEEPDPHDMLGE